MPDLSDAALRARAEQVVLKVLSNLHGDTIGAIETELAHDDWSEAITDALRTVREAQRERDATVMEKHIHDCVHCGDCPSDVVQAIRRQEEGR